MDSTTKKELRIYQFFSHRSWPKSYIGKIMLVAFVGTHIPLLAILGHFLLTTDSASRPAVVYVLWVALAATLTGTGVTLLALNNLLQPIRVTCFALRQYLSVRETPSLPTQFTDEAGLLMSDTQHALVKLDTVIRQLSYYDDLTGLPNRIFFQEQLAQATAAARRQEKALAVLLLDVAGLKDINEVYGRDIGDMALQGVADRISKQVREMDMFARVGDDEFALLQTDVTDQVSVEVQAQRILEIINSRPFIVGDREINVQATIGIAIYPHHDNQPEELLGNAEAARNQAREQKAASFSFYDIGMNARLRRRLELEAGLRSALERNEMELHYQPQVSNLDNTIIGMEALARWNHPEHGPIAPSEFIPIAERSELILQLGEWVLRTACRQNKAWQDAGLPPLRIAVNLSARQFQQPNLVDQVAAILEETGMDVKWLEMEVTESVAMDDTGQAIKVLHGLRDLGVTLSLDDFGTGYSSLSQLGRLPINTLKIDRSFVQDVMENAENASITHAIISLARSLQLEVIAEGIETEAQFEHLKSKGCGQFQGYFFSRPVSAETIGTLLREEKQMVVTA